MKKSSLTYLFLLGFLGLIHVTLSQKTWFTNKVDHFDPLNSATYKQKIIVNSTWYVNGGPIFLFLGGEAPLEFFEFQEVSAKLWAQKLGALYIAIEHRFYGDSMPMPDFSTNNLRYLSSQQALADAAYFIENYNSSIVNPGPWIVFGCSYSGALSAWFRLKYPHLVVGAVAPSGPVLALTNYSGYYAHFQKIAPPDCVNAVVQAVANISQMLLTDDGRNQLSTIFNSCNTISGDPDGYYYFLETLTEVVGSSDQFNNPDAHWPLNQTCQILTQSSDYLANWAILLSQPPPKKGVKKSPSACNNFDEQSAFLKPLMNTQNPDRAWIFQTCTEFGFFSTSYNTIFWDLDLDHQLNVCSQVFGLTGPDTGFTNAYYGGFNLQATNILFTNGIFDPWHLLSINKNLPYPSGVTAVTYAAGHCATMTIPTDEDPGSLTDARLDVYNFLVDLITQK